MTDVAVPPPVIALIPRIGADAFTIWTYLNALADDKGDVDASYQTISDGTGIMAKATLSACIKVLIAVGLLKKRRNYSAAVTYTVIRSLGEPMDSSESAISSKVKRMNAISSSELIQDSINQEVEEEGSKIERMDKTHRIRSNTERLAQIERDNFARMNDAQQAQHVFERATGMGIIPTRNYDKDVSDLGVLIKREGRDGAIARLKEAYDVWTKRKTREGRAYSRTNTGFIEWSINGIPEEYKPNTNGNGHHAPAAQAPPGMDPYTWECLEYLRKNRKGTNRKVALEEVHKHGLMLEVTE